MLDLIDLPLGAREEFARALDLARIPGAVFFRGNSELLSHAMISIAGSREASPWSLTALEGLAGHLAAERCCVVSGGAVGTDSAAHRGALQAGGCSIFVVPCPLEEIKIDSWRPALRGLFDWNRVLFLSPFAPKSIITRSNPLIRNRLIVALGSVAVAGETGIQGGTNHFLHCALTWGVPTFLLDTQPQDTQVRLALAELKRRGAHSFSERDAFEIPLARRIAAAGRDFTARRKDQDNRQTRLCEEECLYAAEDEI